MLTKVAANRCFGGEQLQYTHPSARTGGTMTFSVYLPPGPGPFPVLIWLSGLSCTDQNFVTKAGSQRIAAALGLAIVAPDTSPRGAHVPGDPAGSWDFGHSAGFYVDATEAPWSANYQMHSYIRDELPQVLESLPLDCSRVSLSGHSMGGHGALILALKNPGRYRSVSAFAPICAPSEVPWGEKAFGHFLGPDRERWRAWDAAALVATATERLPILVDQGLADGFLEKQLRPERLESACAAVGHPLELRRREGYDHSYYFVASFLEDHLRWHAAALRQSPTRD